MSKITLGSLFDGAGTCPFAGILNGFEPMWASEIEPFPVEVTSKRFPKMKHLGDITKIKGAEIEPVDVITFGSPCQDLSIAGNQVGLGGERSGLFMEAVRIIKEMRSSTNGKYPRYAVWENVPGAFSSNKGEDFRTVLEELCKVKDSTTVVPRPTDNKGKWKTSGLILADEYSIAWRVLDAQFWGVPQRRRRIYLIADFGGQCAGEVLFKSEGLYRNFAESRKAWDCHSRKVAESLDTEVYDARGNGDGKICPTITGDHENRITDYTAIVVSSWHEKSGMDEVRRLTPTECGRLQGMPDWWCNDIPHKDSNEYKMWGNGMALPCVMYVLENISRVMKNSK